MFNINDKLNRFQFLICILIGTFGCGIVAGICFIPGYGAMDIMGCLFIVLGWLVIVCSMFQRLNDIGWSRWLFLLNFVPYVNILFFIVILFSRGRGLGWT